MAKVDQAFRLGTEFLRGEDRGAPIRNHGRIERRFKHLVLKQHPPIVRQSVVDFARGIEVAIEASGKILLPRKIGTVADPYRQVGRAELAADFDAFDVMFDRLTARAGVLRGERAVGISMNLAQLVLERVGIYRVPAKFQCGGFLAQRLEITDLVPRKVRRHARCHARKLVDDRAIFELFVNVGGLPRNRKLGETRTATASAPRRNGQRKACHPAFDRFDIDVRTRKLSTERRVVIVQRIALARIGLRDQFVGNWQGHGGSASQMPSG